MSSERPRLVSLVDARLGHDDRALALARSAQAQGWDACILALDGGSGVRRGVGQGVPYVRVGLPRAYDELPDQTMRILEDRIAALTVERQALDAAGVSKLSARRRKLVDAIKSLQAARDSVAADSPETTGVADATDELLRAGDVLMRAALAEQPVLVVAHAPVGLHAAWRTATLLRQRGRQVSWVYDLAARLDGPQDDAIKLFESTRLASAAVLVAASEDVAADLKARSGLPVTVVHEVTTQAWQPVLGRAASAAGLSGSVFPVVDPQPAADHVASAPEIRLGIGPANFAGQAWAWGKAVEEHLPGVKAHVFAVQQSVFNFPVDVRATEEEWAELDWQLGQLRRVLGLTHLLDESLRPAFGLLTGSTLSGDLAALRRAGVRIAVLCHGSEVRSPRRHAELYQWSPFDDPAWDAVAKMQETADRNAAILRGFSGPIFVTTPDLLDDVPHASWLPVVVGAENFAPSPPLFAREAPVVIHAPTSPRLKGTELIEPVVTALAKEGLIDYRRMQNLPPEDMPAAIREADIVLDHFVIGNYGVLAGQAMAAGRMVVGHVHRRVRDRLPRACPIVESTPDTLEVVLRTLLADRPAAHAIGAEGVEYVRAVHDGRLAAEILAAWLRG